MQRPAPDSAAGASRVLPVDDLYPLYPQEWVLVRITEMDDKGASTHGEVVVHSFDRGEISKALLDLHRRNPGTRTLIFVGGARRVSPEEWREELAEAAREPLNAWW